MEIIDISLSITNDMWAYKSEWKNNISQISSVLDQGSTVFRFDLCSHTGTYIETSQHKLNNGVLLDDFPLNRFVCEVKLIKLEIDDHISLESFLDKLSSSNIDINEGDALIICSGWGENHQYSKDYISNAPYFEPRLTDFLAKKKLNLLGVDTPVIDSQKKPYFAVTKLFEKNENLLLLAPLVIDHTQVKTGMYMLNTLPLKIPGVSASLCRPFLTKPHLASS